MQRDYRGPSFRRYAWLGRGHGASRPVRVARQTAERGQSGLPNARGIRRGGESAGLAQPARPSPVSWRGHDSSCIVRRSTIGETRHKAACGAHGRAARSAPRAGRERPDLSSSRTIRAEQRTARYFFAETPRSGCTICSAPRNAPTPSWRFVSIEIKTSRKAPSRSTPMTAARPPGR